MNEIDTIGLLETSSIGIGFQAEDAMLKAAGVELLLARTICSGKYLIAVGGDTASVEASVAAGEAVAGDACIESRTIPRVHPSIFPAISMATELDPGQARALGIVETYSASSIIDVADAAAKTANVTLFRVHLAMAIGGKGFVLMTGDVADVRAAVDGGAAVAAADGILVSKVVIPAPSPELFHDWI
jgi:microcompartment protein CcmL/EutN